MNIPIFPEMTGLKLAHRKDFEHFTAEYLPYSDFNFNSLWSYDTKKMMEISQLYDNLIIKFTDYTSDDIFFTYIGKNKPVHTATALLDRAIELDIDPQLKLVPEEIIEELKNNINFILEEDIDQHDNILSVKKLTLLEGKDFETKRWRINQFRRRYPGVFFKHRNLGEKTLKKDVLELFHTWRLSRHLTLKETEIELKALERFLDIEEDEALHCLCFYDDSTLIGFCSFEIMNDSYALGHFMKCDTAYRWIFEHIYHETAVYLNELEIQNINACQDLGLLGLRESKKSWRPVDYLKKYSIKYRA